MTDRVFLAVRGAERQQVARVLLAHADDPYDVQATSDGFSVPRYVWEKAYRLAAPEPAPVPEEPQSDAEPELVQDETEQPASGRDRSGRFAKKKAD